MKEAFFLAVGPSLFAFRALDSHGISWGPWSWGFAQMIGCWCFRNPTWKPVDMDNLPWVLIHFRWLALGFLNHQQQDNLLDSFVMIWINSWLFIQKTSVKKTLIHIDNLIVPITFIGCFCNTYPGVGWQSGGWECLKDCGVAPRVVTRMTFGSQKAVAAYGHGRDSNGILKKEITSTSDTLQFLSCNINVYQLQVNHEFLIIVV